MGNLWRELKRIGSDFDDNVLHSDVVKYIANPTLAFLGDQAEAVAGGLGAEKAPIDDEASTDLLKNSREDYQWSIDNFGETLDGLQGYSDTQLEAALADPANEGIAKEQLIRKLIKGNEQAKFKDEVNKAGITGLHQMAGAWQGADFAQKRMGLRAAAPEVQRVMDRMKKFAGAEAQAGSHNTTRRGLRDWSIARAQAGSSLGATVKGFGMQSIGSAADAAAKRNALNAQQTKAGLGEMLVGVGKGVLMGAPYGPAGMFAGGALGALESYQS